MEFNKTRFMENDTQNVSGSMELCDMGMGLGVQGTVDLGVWVCEGVRV